MDSPAAQREAVNALLAVGLDRLAGVLDGGMAAWTAAARSLDTVPQITPQRLRDLLRQPNAPLVLDVRDRDEWATGHVAGAIHIPFQQLQGRLAEVPHNRSVVAICGGGIRSSLATSVLQRAGYAPVQNVRGGIDAWIAGGLADDDERSGA